MLHNPEASSYLAEPIDFQADISAEDITHEDDPGTFDEFCTPLESSTYTDTQPLAHKSDNAEDSNMGHHTHSPERAFSITSVSGSVASTNTSFTRRTGGSQFSAGPLNVASYSNILAHGRFTNQSPQQKSARNNLFRLRRSIPNVKDIKAPTSVQDRRLRPPFRFVPDFYFKENFLVANRRSDISATSPERLNILKEFMDDEKEYMESLQRIIKKIEKAIYSQPDADTHILKQLMTSFASFSAISGDARQEIERSFGSYMHYYHEYINGIDILTKKYPRIALYLDGIALDMRIPLKRLIEYRFHLRRLQRIEPIGTCGYATASGSIITFSKIVEQAYSLFNINDQFDVIAQWEDLLGVSGCKSIGPESADPNLANKRYAIYTSLTMPLEVPSVALPISPNLHKSIDFTEMNLSLKEAILTVDKHSQAELNTKAIGNKLQLHLFTDTIVLTKPVEVNGVRMLLFPPMPLSHVEVVYRTDVKGLQKIFELKISPFKMLVLSGESEVVQEFLDYFKALKCDMESSSVINDELTLSTNSTLAMYYSLVGSSKYSIGSDNTSPSVSIIRSAQKARLSLLPESAQSSAQSVLQDGEKSNDLVSGKGAELISKNNSALRIVNRTLLFNSDVQSTKFVKLGRTFTESNPVLSLYDTSMSIPKALAPIITFHEICRPHMLKPGSHDWEMLSKCHMRIYTSRAKSWITLNIEDTETVILTAAISPFWTCTKTGERSILVNLITNQGTPMQYMLSLKSSALAQTALTELHSKICHSLWILRANIQDQLLIKKPTQFPQLPFNQISRSVMPRIPTFETKMGLNHKQCWLFQGDQINICLGPVKSMIVTTSTDITQLCAHAAGANSSNTPNDKTLVTYSTRLTLISSLRPDQRLLNVELEPENISIQVDDNMYVNLKIYSESLFFEYKLSTQCKETTVFLDMLDAELKKAEAHRADLNEKLDQLRAALEENAALKQTELDESQNAFQINEISDSQENTSNMDISNDTAAASNVETYSPEQASIVAIDANDQDRSVELCPSNDVLDATPSSRALLLSDDLAEPIPPRSSDCTLSSIPDGYTLPETENAPPVLPVINTGQSSEHDTCSPNTCDPTITCVDEIPCSSSEQPQSSTLVESDDLMDVVESFTNMSVVEAGTSIVKSQEPPYSSDHADIGTQHSTVLLEQKPSSTQDVSPLEEVFDPVSTPSNTSELRSRIWSITGLDLKCRMSGKDKNSSEASIRGGVQPLPLRGKRKVSHGSTRVDGTTKPFCGVQDIRERFEKKDLDPPPPLVKPSIMSNWRASTPSALSRVIPRVMPQRWSVGSNPSEETLSADSHSHSLHAQRLAEAENNIGNIKSQRGAFQRENLDLVRKLAALLGIRQRLQDTDDNLRRENSTLNRSVPTNDVA
ncbi:hypothetical protein BASA62_001751 [Batrachochytrium salamandrivorans]|nr:hypothetical protein BASA62_001751 [Batrachochytrium salamandrivorans]